MHIFPYQYQIKELKNNNLGTITVIYRNIKYGIFHARTKTQNQSSPNKSIAYNIYIKKELKSSL